MHMCKLFVEFEKQRLGAIRPLTELVTAATAGLHDSEDHWRKLCEARFGLSVSP